MAVFSAVRGDALDSSASCPPIQPFLDRFNFFDSSSPYFNYGGRVVGFEFSNADAEVTRPRMFCHRFKFCPLFWFSFFELCSESSASGTSIHTENCGQSSLLHGCLTEFFISRDFNH
jgi:hypothetical protein